MPYLKKGCYEKVIFFIFPVLFIGCSIFNSDDEQAKAIVYADQNLIKHLAFKVKLNDGINTYSFSNPNFRREESTSEFRTPKVETTTDGSLYIAFKLLYLKTKQLISQGSFTLDLQDNWVNVISFNIDTVNTRRVINYGGPWHKVFGCMGPGCPWRRSFSIDVSSVDSLSTLSDDVLYVFISGKFINPPHNHVIY